MPDSYIFDWVVVKRVQPAVPAGAPPLGPGAGPLGAGGADPADIGLIAGEEMPLEHSVITERMSFEDGKNKAAEEDVVGAAIKMPFFHIKGRSDDADEDAGRDDSWGIAAIGADRSPWDGEGITVAVLDTGIDAGHSAFDGVEIVSENFTNDPFEDHLGHGTHCAGTIFGRDVNGRRIGIARGVKKALIGKIIGPTTVAGTETVTQALSWALSKGADVISMSIGMDFYAYQELLKVTYQLPPPKAAAVALEAYGINVRLFDDLSRSSLGAPPLAKGAVVVCAAGNESDRPNYGLGATPPGNATEFIAVAALDDAGSLAGFSNAKCKLAAPGTNILSARRGGGLRRDHGTSMATPHVAGAACLWMQKLRRGGLPAHAGAVITRLTQSAAALDLVKADDVFWGGVRAPLN